MRAIVCAGALIVAVGCFADAPPLHDGTTGAEAECPIGVSGCACNGNGTCDVGLECAALVDLCVPAGCAAGSEGCICLAADCLAGLTCTDGLCLAPSAESTSAAASTMAVDDDATTIAGADDGDPGSTTPTQPESSSGAESSTGSTDCWDDGDGCDECQSCIDAVVGAGDCTLAIFDCTGDCVFLRECHASGESTGQCCLDHSTSVGEYHTLVCCALALCPSCMETLCTPNIC